MIVGIDEVGRGPWAGPLVMGAVVLGDVEIPGLTDSKKLSPKARQRLNDEIQAHAAAVGLGWVHADEIDRLGLSKSLELACIRALEGITVPYHEIIIDGTVNFLQATGKGPYVTTMKKADLLIASVSAASIVAKVARDTWMAAQDEAYPQYGFGSHVGYGTSTHRTALEVHGVTPLHRKSFAPIAALLRGASPERESKKAVTTRQIGDVSEAVAASWLEVNGYSVRERNWKTARCEIDIVAEKHGRLYFVEVKHRQDATRGGGLAAVTAQKQRQMRFAADMYSNRVGYAGDCRLVVMTTTGVTPRFESLVELD